MAGVIGAVPRAEMPQIPAAMVPAWLAWLKAAGVPVVEKVVPAAALAATQKEICPEKVAAMAGAPAAVLAKPVMVAVDGWVLDGHHHWAHHAVAGEMVPVIEIGMEMAELLPVAVAWAEAA